MDDVKESPCYEKCKSLLFTSTPYKNFNDSGYNTPCSTLTNASSNLSHISEASIVFDHTSLDSSLLQLSSNTPTLPQKTIEKKSKVVIKTFKSKKCSSSSVLTYTENSPSKKFKYSSDLRMRFRLNNCCKNDENVLIKKSSCSSSYTNYNRVPLEGRDKIDIMYFLGERHHFLPVIEKICSYLSDVDIISISMVSKIWNNAIKYSPSAQKKKNLYFKLSKENRENEGHNRAISYRKGHLVNIGNVMCSPVKRDLILKSPPVSPSKFRWHVFQKEARKLKFNQRLIQCPLCRKPSSWAPSQSTKAQCHGLHCGFTFCTSCMCEYSDISGHKCKSVPISSNIRRTLVSSISKSKHNLRRLL
ncbi:F-box only protein 5-like [Daktulosphaira vitifoliae]|uniref:F-box only protein 5-like n=1 Tax=Daktulosphaira vitifoliae TaxID=58002 RepID=UPI0021AAF240|nr:F-box only protein 5-like [Daktulosphaira vitifoliae]